MSLVSVGVRLTSLCDGVSLTISCFGILATALLTPWWLMIRSYHRLMWGVMEAPTEKHLESKHKTLQVGMRSEHTCKIEP